MMLRIIRMKENIRYRLQTTEVRANINTFHKIRDINKMPANFMLLHLKIIS